MISTRSRRNGAGGVGTPSDAAPSGVSFTTAIRRGLAPDGGLYLPTRLPRVTAVTLRLLREAAVNAPGSPEALALTARHILEPFLDDPADTALRENLPELCRHAFETPIPLRDLDERTSLLELHHGPTAAFKDMAARFLAGALSAVGMRGHVLVATSGDTGSAVAAAFEGRPGFRVSVLFPARGVSERQAHLLSCFGGGGPDGEGGGNVRSYRVEGTFDDAQAMVKAALADPELVREHGLTSANSISLGRLLPQATWFAHAALAREPGGDGRGGTATPGFVIPSGNFGHGLAALWARQMGFPVGPVHLATNRNRALVDWFEHGRAAPRTSVRTPANAMDVGVPSNLERLRFQVDADPAFARDVTASAVGDAEILAAVGHAPERWGVTVCPHTACALHALADLRARRADPRPWIVTATAHPAKFPEVVEPQTGAQVPLPPALVRLLERPARSRALAPDWGALKDALSMHRKTGREPEGTHPARSAPPRNRT
ncbi:MAG: threonine synthase [Gemmatimonadales bacterium]|nr:MAG: threonine synthase [Gemmatimonadales bacterium]